MKDMKVMETTDVTTVYEEAFIINQTLHTMNYEQKRVKDLVAKLDPYQRESGKYAFTFLHDHERELISEFILYNEPTNDNALMARNDQDYNLNQLAKDANHLLGPLGV